MPKTFVIADNHFNHENILKFEPMYRPFKDVTAMNEYMISRWNETVGKNDIVYHLGDVVFGHDLSFVKRLNGHKFLVFGNHDNHFPIQKFIDNGFENFYGMIKVGKYFLTHCPMHKSEMIFYPGKKNIHGHIHSRIVLTKDLKPDTDYINVGVELTDYKPIDINEIEKYQSDLFNDKDKVGHAIRKHKADIERCYNDSYIK